MNSNISDTTRAGSREGESNWNYDYQFPGRGFYYNHPSQSSYPQSQGMIYGDSGNSHGLVDGSHPYQRHAENGDHGNGIAGELNVSAGHGNGHDMYSHIDGRTQQNFGSHPHFLHPRPHAHDAHSYADDENMYYGSGHGYYPYFYPTSGHQHYHHHHHQQYQYEPLLSTSSERIDQRLPQKRLFPHGTEPTGGERTLLAPDAQAAKKRRKYRKTKRADDMPRRPLSAYNFFFSEEREIVIALLPCPPKEGEGQKEDCPSLCSLTSTDCSSHSRNNNNEESTTQQEVEAASVKSEGDLKLVTKGEKENENDVPVDEMDVKQLQELLSSRRLPEEEFKVLKQKIQANTQRILDTHLEGDRKKKSHKKSHGKINFQKLAQLIGQRWRDIDDEVQKQYYFNLAKKDLDRFNAQLMGMETSGENSGIGNSVKQNDVINSNDK